MTRLSRYRRPLRISTLFVLSLGVFLSRPSAPISRLHLSDPFNPSRQSLAMQAPHTLVWTTHSQATITQTRLYDPLTFTVQYTLTHTYNLASSSDIGSSLCAISADGQWLVIATAPQNTDGTFASTGFIELWSLTDQHQIAQIAVVLDNPRQYFRQVVISDDGQRIGWITFGERASSVHIWDRSTQHIIFLRTYDDTTLGLTSTIVVVHAAEPIVMRTDNRILEARRIRDDTLLYQIRLGTDERAAAFCTTHSDETWQACVGIGLVTVRRVADGQLLQRFPMRYQDVFQQGDTWKTTVAFSPDHRFLLTAASLTRSRPGLEIGRPNWALPATEPAVLWDLQTGQVVQRFDVTSDGAFMVAYSPDGQYVAAYGKQGAGSNSGEIRIFRVAPQPPFLQPGCILVGFFLALLVFWQWLWARR